MSGAPPGSQLPSASSNELSPGRIIESRALRATVHQEGFDARRIEDAKALLAETVLTSGSWMLPSAVEIMRHTAVPA
jgi:hypothetical protein